MEKKNVKDLMVPLSEYATVSRKATLYEAVVALEETLAGFDPTRHRHRAILIFDENNKIIGKISHIDILQALEPRYEDVVNRDSFARLGLSPMYQKSLMEQYALWNKPLSDLSRKAAKLKVETFMQTLTQGEHVDENVSLDKAIHQLIMGKHQSLLVTQKKNIIGVLRLTDVFLEIVEEIKASKL
ncbi:MAG: CBS domain-containing protein [Deltaproteobacteria bacterium]|nr:CBS domain-containing protein [Deltaproteobacteria bacterium]